MIGVSGAADLPWRSGRDFRLWRYGVGHSQLLLRSPGEGVREALTIKFEAVEFMKLRRGYTDLVLRLPLAGEEAEFEQVASLPIPQLYIVLESRTHVGFVSCARLIVRKVGDQENDSGDRGELLLLVTRPRH
jgi:hypothetical protein